MHYTFIEKTYGNFPQVISVMAAIPTALAFSGVMCRAISTLWNTCQLTWSIMATPSWSCFLCIWLNDRRTWSGSNWRRFWPGHFHWRWWVRSGVACAHWSRYFYAPIRSNQIATLSGSGGELNNLCFEWSQVQLTHPFKVKRSWTRTLPMWSIR